MHHIPSDNGPGAIEFGPIEMRRRSAHCATSRAELDAIDAEAIATERAIEAALRFEPVTPDDGACAAANTNEIFTAANARN